LENIRSTIELAFDATNIPVFRFFRYFIDRDGRLFHHILNFLRQGVLPPLEDSFKVYQEAQYYNIAELCAALEVLRPVAGEKLRRKFLDQVRF